jgi:hypothetical protein
MIVIIGRFKFLAMVCSGVFAFARAIKARSSIIDQGARRNFLAMLGIEPRRWREGKPASSVGARR